MMMLEPSEAALITQQPTDPNAGMAIMLLLLIAGLIWFKILYPEWFE